MGIWGKGLEQGPSPLRPLSEPEPTPPSHSGQSEEKGPLRGQISSGEAALASFALLADGYLVLSSVHLLAEDCHNYTHYKDEKVEGPTQHHTAQQGPSTRSSQAHLRG